VANVSLCEVPGGFGVDKCEAARDLGRGFRPERVIFGGRGIWSHGHSQRPQKGNERAQLPTMKLVATSDRNLCPREGPLKDCAVRRRRLGRCLVRK
jgi:hypothetical protein